MGINKSQAAALASGFLEELGTNERAGLQPKETLSILFQLAGELVDECQTNLNASHKVASGKLSESLQVLNPVQSGTSVQVSVEMLEYGLYVNSGVKGTETGSSTAGYAFKKGFPNTKMANEIQKWIKRSGLQVKNSNRSKTTSGLEQKRHSISDLNKGRAVAFAVATNIKRYGIKGTGFLDKAIKTTEAKVDQRFGQAFEVDILNSLPNKL